MGPQHKTATKKKEPLGRMQGAAMDMERVMAQPVPAQHEDKSGWFVDAGSSDAPMRLQDHMEAESACKNFQTRVMAA